MEERNKCIAIAFSGGLDSSVVPVLLHEFYGYSYRDMISVLFDVGQDEKEIEIAEKTRNLIKKKVGLFSNYPSSRKSERRNSS